jgi:endonuclease/exonuclease/phosphatase (EEP) superfamily protein YafD
MRLVRRMLGAFGLVLATVSGALALLAQGGRFSPQLDAITHAAPLLLVGALAGGVFSCLEQGRARAAGLALSALGILGACALIAPEYLRDTGPKAASDAPGQIKVIQFNTWRGNRDFDRIASWLKQENPDFAVLEEVTPELRDRIVVRTGWTIAGSRSNTMIFSHRPYLVMKRPKIPGGVVTWVNASYDNPTGPIEVVVTHMPWPNDPAEPQAAADIHAVLAQLPRRRMILAGDFNSTPWSFQRRRSDTNLGLTRRDRALWSWPAQQAAEWRWPAPFPFLPIDHLYAGAGWATVSVKRGPRLGSDHFPIVVTLAPVGAR